MSSFTFPDSQADPLWDQAESLFKHPEKLNLLDPDHYVILQSFLFFKNYMSRGLSHEALQDPTFLYHLTCGALFEMLRANGFAVGNKYMEDTESSSLEPERRLQTWNKKGFLMDKKTIKALQQFLLTLGGVEIVPNEADNGFFGESTIKALTSFCILVKQGTEEGEAARETVLYNPDEFMKVISYVPSSEQSQISDLTGGATTSSNSSFGSGGSGSSGSGKKVKSKPLRKVVSRVEEGSENSSLSNLVNSTETTKGSSPMGGEAQNENFEYYQPSLTASPSSPMVPPASGSKAAPNKHRALLDQQW